MPSVAGVLRDAALALAGVSETPRLDVELLLARVLGADRSRLVLDARESVDPADLARFDAFVARRAAREPVAYILGRKEFRRISLSVDRRVLIPRPETELLVEVGVSLPRGSRVVDVGTGSGAVALALKDERPDLVVIGTDVSADAVAVAQENAVRLGLDVSFFLADLLDGVPGPVDAVLANLPYVAAGFDLPADVALYEPGGALFGGLDGLDVIRRLVAAVAARSDVGVLALEVGLDQAGGVSSLLSGAGYSSIDVLRDLAGHERVVVAHR